MRDSFVCATLVGVKRVLPAGEGEAVQVRLHLWPPQVAAPAARGFAKHNKTKFLLCRISRHNATFVLISGCYTAAACLHPSQSAAFIAQHPLLSPPRSVRGWRSCAAAWSPLCRAWATSSPPALCASIPAWQQVGAFAAACCAAPCAELSASLGSLVSARGAGGASRVLACHAAVAVGAPAGSVVGAPARLAEADTGRLEQCSGSLLGLQPPWGRELEGVRLTRARAMPAPPPQWTSSAWAPSRCGSGTAA